MYFRPLLFPSYYSPGTFGKVVLSILGCTRLCAGDTFKNRQFMDELAELQGWSGLKRSVASFRVTTNIFDFGPVLLAGIYAFFECITST